MMDLLHNLSLEDDGFQCGDCGVKFDVSIAALGTGQIVELGGGGIHFLPIFAYDGKAKSCASVKQGTKLRAIIVCVDCKGEADDCETCNGLSVITSDGESLLVEAAQPARGETLEVAPKKTEVEKMVSRGSFQTFLQMKEATRPQ